MKDIEGIASIKLMVDDFYSAVRKDDLLGPVFNAVIRDDWQPHLNKMYDFWNTVLFGVAAYKGNPSVKHAPLPINARHFERWLLLFGQTVDIHFAGKVAEEAKKRAGTMATMFQEKLKTSTDKDKIIF